MARIMQKEPDYLHQSGPDPMSLNSGNARCGIGGMRLQKNLMLRNLDRSAELPDGREYVRKIVQTYATVRNGHRTVPRVFATHFRSQVKLLAYRHFIRTNAAAPAGWAKEGVYVRPCSILLYSAR